ncbi:MAG TPA: DUF2314 domain-containing protein [Gemmataceae bacterium]|nr:DUF2314 domain-containing protein [Gemmataceae bacterium]
MIWVVLGVIVALAAGGIVYWRLRRRRRHRLISLVGLLREPVTFDPAVLAKVAGKAWNADLGDGESEGADGFVAGAGIMNTIVHDGRMILINSFPKPYVEDPEEAAEGIPDLRVRSLFREHRAWFSCDALGVDHSTPEDEVRSWYQSLGKLFVGLLDENCLLIFLPDTSQGFPVNEDTEAALRSLDPVEELCRSSTVPIIEVSDDDPLMKEAVARARREWPKFVSAFEANAGENFSVKAPVSHSGNTEFIWITVTAIEGESVFGKLANDPGDLGPLRLGSKVTVPVANLNDWCYLDAEGKLNGGFTIEAVQKATRRPRKRESEAE